METLRVFSLTAIYIGIAMAVTLWASNFSDFMLLEDLGLEDSEAASALRKVSPGERVFLNMSAVITMAGFVGLLVALFLRRKNLDETRPSESNF